MTPDSIPSQAPITLSLQRDTAWLLGTILIAGVWTIVSGAIDILSTVIRRAYVRRWR